MAMVGNKGCLRRMLQVYLTVGQILRAASPTADFARFGQIWPRKIAERRGFGRFSAGEVLGGQDVRPGWAGQPSMGPVDSTLRGSTNLMRFGECPGVSPLICPPLVAPRRHLPNIRVVNSSRRREPIPCRGPIRGLTAPGRSRLMRSIDPLHP